jgi:23S rRNA (uracil1939-C5)-methyltransferase
MPLCQHAEQCPGCPLITQPYDDGLALKAARLGRASARYSELVSLVPEAVIAADSLINYRVRAKLVTDDEGRLGLFAAGSHEVVDTPGCRVLAPKLADVASALRALLPLDISLRGVDLRLCDGGVLVCLIVVGRPDASALERCRQQVLEHVPHVVSLAVSFTRADSVQLLGSELEVLHGKEAEPHHLSEGVPWHYASHGAFTQVHAGQTASLHERIEQVLHTRLGGLEGRRVLELYAGSGALGLRLAARGARVSAVECFEPALARLASAALAQSLRIETRAADAEQFLQELLEKPPPERGFDVVLVNPPRRGLTPGVRRAIAALGPTLLLYVSCEPETLARDLAHFSTLGWAASRLLPFDMIPMSDAVECMAVLEAGAKPEPRVLFEDERSLALFKPAFEATTAEGESSSSLLGRVRGHAGLAGLTPVHRLDVGTSGVCWFARRPEDVALLARALTGKTYLALAMGITHKKGKIMKPLLEGRQRRSALTRYRRQRVVGGHSLLELEPVQARKHQLRRHLAAIGHAVLGDVQYGQAAANRHFEHRHGLDRPFLHCASLRIELPAGPVEIRAELPGDLTAVLDSLEHVHEPKDR